MIPVDSISANIPNIQAPLTMRNFDAEVNRPNAIREAGFHDEKVCE
jgi:hypothetical protein